MSKRKKNTKAQKTETTITVEQETIRRLFLELSDKVDPDGYLRRNLVFDFTIPGVIKIGTPVVSEDFFSLVTEESFTVLMNWSFTGILENFKLAQGTKL